MTRRAVFALLAALALAGALAPACADDDGEDREEYDHDAALAAVARGEALPLTQVIARVAPELGGEVVEIEFERKKGRWVYEFKVIDRGGRVHGVYVDALTARVVNQEGGHADPAD